MGPTPCGRGGTISYPISFKTAYTVTVCCSANRSSGLSGSQSCCYVYTISNNKVISGSYDTGNGYNGVTLITLGI